MTNTGLELYYAEKPSLNGLLPKLRLFAKGYPSTEAAVDCAVMQGMDDSVFWLVLDPRRGEVAAGSQMALDSLADYRHKTGSPAWRLHALLALLRDHPNFEISFTDNGPNHAHYRVVIKLPGLSDFLGGTFSLDVPHTLDEASALQYAKKKVQVEIWRDVTSKTFNGTAYINARNHTMKASFENDFYLAAAAFESSQKAKRLPGTSLVQLITNEIINRALALREILLPPLHVDDDLLQDARLERFAFKKLSETMLEPINHSFGRTSERFSEAAQLRGQAEQLLRGDKLATPLVFPDRHWVTCDSAAIRSFLYGAVIGSDLSWCSCIEKTVTAAIDLHGCACQWLERLYKAAPSTILPAAPLAYSPPKFTFAAGIVTAKANGTLPGYPSKHLATADNAADLIAYLQRHFTATPAVVRNHQDSLAVWVNEACRKLCTPGRHLFGSGAWKLALLEALQHEVGEVSLEVVFAGVSQQLTLYLRLGNQDDSSQPVISDHELVQDTAVAGRLATGQVLTFGRHAQRDLERLGFSIELVKAIDNIERRAQPILKAPALHAVAMDPSQQSVRDAIDALSGRTWRLMQIFAEEPSGKEQHNNHQPGCGYTDVNLGILVEQVAQRFAEPHTAKEHLLALLKGCDISCCCSYLKNEDDLKWLLRQHDELLAECSKSSL